MSGTHLIVQSVNSEVLVGMGRYVVCTGIHEGNGVAVAEVDNNIPTNLRDTICKIIRRIDIKAVNALLDLEDVFTWVEIKDDVVSAAAIEQEDVTTGTADKDVIAGAAIEDVVAVSTLQDIVPIAAKEKV